MKIGLISFHSFVQPGGVKNHVLGLHKEFIKRGVQSKIIVPRRSRLENYGKDVILLGTSFPFPFSGSQSDFCINFNPLAIEALLKKERFDVLHFHNFGFPSVFQILERSSSLNILTIHADLKGSGLFKKFPTFLYPINKIVQWKIDGIIGVAPLTLKFFKNFQGPKLVIPNGIDLEEFNPNIPKIKRFSDGKIKAFNKLSLDSEQRQRVNLLFVGRIEKRKGLIYLLKAYKILIKKFPNLRLIAVGEGPLKVKCQQWAKKNNLTEVCFVGEKTGKELPQYYASSDIFCSPAIFGESFGIVLLEAMASGLPIAAFANQGYKEFMKGKKGEEFLARPKDYKALAKKIEILAQDNLLRKKIGEWGIKEAQNYSWQKIAGEVLEFYQSCSKTKQRKLSKKEHFLFDKFIDKAYNKEILSWLK